MRSEYEKAKRWGGVNRVEIVKLAINCRQMQQGNSSFNYIILI
ncbi:hypothetical protein Sbal183_2347 [Shewanella baltica OS183]|nr:hypothetical protein Sbal175_1956 [Shewanella baltica BA175]EHQ15244.1 hypothetical protein Sbal183_2347 [Shewanella baltica OS183]